MRVFGGLFVLAGLLLVAGALVPADGGAFRGGVRPALLLAAGGLSLAFATGTRISLLLILPVVGFTLLLRFRDFRWSFLWFGLGGALGLFLTYGLFALDPVSLRALLAAQGYHAARGGFDPFFAVGSVSRLARWRSASARRSSRATPCSSTAAWTSAPPSPPNRRWAA